MTSKPKHTDVKAGENGDVKVKFLTITIGNLLSMGTMLVGLAVMWGTIQSDVKRLIETSTGHSQELLRLNTEGSSVMHQRFAIVDKTLDLHADQIRNIQLTQFSMMERLQVIQTDVQWIKERMQQQQQQKK